MSSATYGALLALSGNALLAAVLVVALHLLLVVASSAKRRVLGEPLLFSDLALVGAVFRHPQFYFSALETWHKATGIAALAVIFAALAILFEENLPLRVGGLVIAGVSLLLIFVVLKTRPFRSLGRSPNIELDVAKLGLLPTLLIYWIRWIADSKQGRVATNSDSNSAQPRAQETQPELLVVVQCESFADPVELFGNHALQLPHLEQARSAALQWGNLEVSGFGAYTMRTEYGVLFGQDEEELGFRRYDPYLTAINDSDFALPRRLGEERWQSHFVHPHDMRFYNRHQILPRAGFTELVGSHAFAPPSPSEGRYVTDGAVADKILELAGNASSPTFLYAVTIENHGPWAESGLEEAGSLLDDYNRLVRAGDAMLGQLIEGLSEQRKPALLVFFGDHRPSIPGFSEPGGDRHTPYVILKLDEHGQVITAANERRDISPAELHHAILGFATSPESFAKANS
ncbi:LTA synthase family protein [Erythrobacter sp. KMU-140]|uniref:LTA synthase family protein n=2 Tax=Erythrobacter rubeus TaxID=2760803 RepID=A0ABR8KL40_9SPHN|nr:LTA synthase family protein [Erythrobacter rubeus]